MRPHPRRARTDSSSPRAWGTSDRNGMISNHEDMVFQHDWAGTGLVNKNILISRDELDVPQRQLGAVILPPDPPPIMNARPENYNIDEAGPPPLYTTESGDVFYVTSDSAVLATYYESSET